MNSERIGIDTGVLSPAPRQGHVLVVDDDAASRERVANYLTLNDFRVTPAENGKRMMEILHEESVDLVALELTLRGEDGHQLASRLRETSMVPIIIVTSRAEEADRVMGLERAKLNSRRPPVIACRNLCVLGMWSKAKPSF